MSTTIFFGAFMLLIILMLALDLGVFHKQDHVIKMKEAAVWTVIWISLALLFSLVIRFHAEWVHGISSMEELLAIVKGTDMESLIRPGMDYATAIEAYRKEMTNQYIAGYFLEKSLSIDNIFVMIMIFVSFGVDKKYYHRVLFWGILGAIVLRLIFIFGLGALISKFSWVLAIFGFILIYSGIKMFKDDKDEEIDTEKHPVVRFASKYFNVSTKMDGHNFFTKINGKRYMTPLFLVLLIIEGSDIIFAVDSIPAVFSVTTDPFIVCFSNIFAIMGLRSLFFLMSDITDKFWLLKYGLGVLLCFVGVKMLLHEFFHIAMPTQMSLIVILSVLFGSIVLSLIFTKKSTSKADGI